MFYKYPKIKNISYLVPGDENFFNITKKEDGIHINYTWFNKKKIGQWGQRTMHFDWENSALKEFKLGKDLFLKNEAKLQKLADYLCNSYKGIKVIAIVFYGEFFGNKSIKRLSYDFDHKIIFYDILIVFKNKKIFLTNQIKLYTKFALPVVKTLATSVKINEIIKEMEEQASYEEMEGVVAKPKSPIGFIDKKNYNCFKFINNKFLEITTKKLKKNITILDEQIIGWFENFLTWNRLLNVKSKWNTDITSKNINKFKADVLADIKNDAYEEFIKTVDKREEELFKRYWTKFSKWSWNHEIFNDHANLNKHQLQLK